MVARVVLMDERRADSRAVAGEGGVVSTRWVSRHTCEMGGENKRRSPTSPSFTLPCQG